MMHLEEEPVLYIFMSPTCSTMLLWTILATWSIEYHLLHHPLVIPGVAGEGRVPIGSFRTAARHGEVVFRAILALCVPAGES